VIPRLKIPGAVGDDGILGLAVARVLPGPVIWVGVEEGELKSSEHSPTVAQGSELGELELGLGVEDDKVLIVKVSVSLSKER